MICYTVNPEALYCKVILYEICVSLFHTTFLNLFLSSVFGSNPNSRMPMNWSLVTSTALPVRQLLPQCLVYSITVLLIVLKILYICCKVIVRHNEGLMSSSIDEYLAISSYAPSLALELGNAYLHLL